MKKIKDKCQEIICNKNLYIFSIITIVFFGAFCILQYAPDTYSVFTNGARNTVLHFFSCGRYITGIATVFSMKILNLTNEGIYYLSYGFAIICTIISLYKLNELIRKDIKNNVLSIIITVILIINPFSIELYMYIEKGIMILSVLLCILAVEQMDKFFNGNKKAIIYALILMFIANCSYQGTVGIFVAISLIYIIKYSKNIKSFIINNIIVALVYGIPAILNFLSVRFLFNNARVNGNMVLFESMIKVFDGTKRMLINTYNILPKYVFMVAITFILLVIIYKSIKEKNNKKQKMLKIAGAFYIILGIFFATVAPQILQDTNSIWFVARSSYPMAAVIGILLLYLCSKFDINTIEKYIIIIFIVILVTIQFMSFIKLTIHNYIGNYMDKQLTLKIEDQIKKYEENTGKTVEFICIYHDKSTKYVYDELKASGDMNIRAYSADWCVPKILELYTKRKFKVIEENKEIKEKFSQEDWNDFDEQQIIFHDNVMHLCIF